MKRRVRLYTLSTCSHCKKAKRFLDDSIVSYEFTDVDLLSREDRAKVLEEIRKVNPLCSFPTILIGDQVIAGFNEDKLRKELGL